EPTHGGGAVPASCSGAPTTVKHRERTVGAACARRACVAGVVSITSITRVLHARDRPCHPRAHPQRATPALHAPTVAKDGYERSEPLFSQRWSYEPGLDGRDACLAPLNMLRASYPGPRTPPRPGTGEQASPPQPTSTPSAQPTRISHSAHAPPMCTAHVRGPRASHPSVDSRSTRLGRKLTWRRGALASAISSSSSARAVRPIRSAGCATEVRGTTVERAKAMSS